MVDAAHTPSAADVTARADVVRALNLGQALKKNRARREPLSTTLELLIEARAEGGGETRSSTSDSDSTDDDDRRGASADRRPQPPVTVALPSGGPLGGSSRPASARPRPASARPASAMPGGPRTPHSVSDGVFKVTCSELPNRAAATAGGGVPRPAQRGSLVSFIGKRGERVLVPPGGCDGGSVELLELEDCEVLVLDWSVQVVVDSCRRCRILIGPVDGSLMMRNCHEVDVSAVCRQLRCRECADCALLLFTHGPIIESSTRMRFGPWNGAYPGLGAHLAAARIDPAASNQWADVHDYNDPQRVASEPNWTKIDPAAAAAAWVIATVPGDEGGARYGRSENPLTPRGAGEQPLAAAATSGEGTAPPRGVSPSVEVEARDATAVAVTVRWDSVAELS